LKTGDYYALVISNLGAQTRLHSNSATLKAALAGQAPQPIPPEGLVFDNLKSDSEFSVGEGDKFRSFPAEIGNAPALSVVLSADPSTGTVRVESSVNGADVTLQGRKPRHIHGAATTLLLAAGTYIGLRIKRRIHGGNPNASAEERGDAQAAGVRPEARCTACFSRH
jgi:hypothetical protein